MYSSSIIKSKLRCGSVKVSITQFQRVLVKYIIIFITLIYPNLVYALSAPKPAERISIAVSPSVAPYVIEENGTGLQLQIFKAAFNSQGINDIDIIYMSNKRAEKALQDGIVDVVMDYAGTCCDKIYKSNSLFSFQNVAVSLKSRGYEINNQNDLLNKSVLAFQHASELMTSSFHSITESVQYYDEVINQEAQIDNLLKGWIDIIIVEKRVLVYYLQQIDAEKLKPVDVHLIFPEVARPAYFNSKVLQEIFDLGLAHIISNGEYAKIMAFDENEFAQTQHSPNKSTPFIIKAHLDQFN